MKIETPVTKAYFNLVDLYRSDASMVDARLSALTWLAAGRMVSLGRAPGIASTDDLTHAESWQALERAGFPSVAVSYITAQGSSASAKAFSAHAKAAAIVTVLAKEMGKSLWDVLPCLRDSNFGRYHDDIPVLANSVATLMFNLLKAPEHGTIWIPFDSSGQLTVMALRRGYMVMQASPLPAPSILPQLLLTIESGSSRSERIQDEIERDDAGRPISTAEYALVVPPVGMKIANTPMEIWSVAQSRKHAQYPRSESWALHEFFNRMKNRAVFLMPQGILFTQGQEQELREYLTYDNGDNYVEEVVSLPSGVYGDYTSIAGALIVTSKEKRGADTKTIFMSDLGNGRHTSIEMDDAILMESSRQSWLTANAKGRLVTIAEVAQNDYSFTPSRYLQKIPELGETATRLGDICEVVRPPLVVKDATKFNIVEVGLSDLGSWHSIVHAPEKISYLKAPPKGSALIQDGDIILSVKGTTGQTALMGHIIKAHDMVPSQSCVSLRINKNKVQPEYLLMFLRSPHGQLQLERLRAGTGVQHISPNTLLNQLLIPLPPLDEQREVAEEYHHLCRLEEQIAKLKQEMIAISEQRWPAK
jgi:hypothetical protein